MLKKELRELYIKKRSDLTSEQFKRKSEELTRKIVERILALGIKDVFIFLPINREFDCRPLAEVLWEEDFKTYIPVSDFECKTMLFSEYTSKTILVEKKYGILEPKDCIEYSPVKAIVVTPLLVADEKLNRVGYGGGFYDRFFNENDRLFKLGISFFPPLDRIDDVNKFDVKLDEVIY